jgi:CRISPR-associated endonuclease Cas1
MQVNQGSLVVKNGFTHYPQKQDERRFFPGDTRMPSRIVILDGSGSLTLDVMSWLTDRNIPLVRIDWRGKVVTLSGSSYGLDPERVRSQLCAQTTGPALRAAIALVFSKLRNCLDTISTLPISIERDRALEKHKREITLLKRTPPRTLGKLLGIEGTSAASYFAAWQDVQIQWKGTKRRPIPPDWLSFSQRTSNKGKKGYNIGATHPINAVLNYAYAVLESHVRIEVIAKGYDPKIGYLHSYKEGRDAFVLDLMEPLRPIVDRAIIEFIQSTVFQPADFTIREDGICRLNPQMAKRVALLALNSLAGKNALGQLPL